MSRSGYVDDYDENFPNALAFYRSSVDGALMGKRGQKFLRDLITALDAMPEKKLASDALEYPDGSVCAIGAVGRMRGIDMSRLDVHDADLIGKVFGIAPCMAKEIVFENDEHDSWTFRAEPETDEQRWDRMRAWATGNLR